MARNQEQHGPRDELVAYLLDKIEEDTYPSSTMMSFVEEMLRPDELEDYAEILLAKITSDTYPSIDLMARVRSIS